MDSANLYGLPYPGRRHHQTGGLAGIGGREHEKTLIHNNRTCLLRDSDRLLNVFIAADLGDRVARVCRHAGEGMTESKALSLIEDIDRKRSSYYNYFTGRTWGDTAVYDICLNSTTLGYEKCADIIVSLAKERLGI